MGGGGTKAHESFTVTPSTTTTALEPPPDTGPVGGAQGQVISEEKLISWLEETGELTTFGSPEPEVDNGLMETGLVEAGAEETELGPADVTAGGVEGLVEDPPAIEPEELTPVPTGVDVGNVTGEPLLVGGADLVDSLATLVSYDSPGGPREVLLTTLEPDAEAKLMEALSLSETKMVPIQVEEEVKGRLPADQEHKIYEELVTAAKSTNHHLKQGDAIPAHTLQRVATAQSALEEIAASPGATQADLAMVDHYQQFTAELLERSQPGYSVPYTEGGKSSVVTPFETTGKVMVTKHVPAPADGPVEGQLPASIRTVSRIAPVLASDGGASWDGKARRNGQGKEYVVDLGDGYSAVYKPYAANDPATADFSLRGGLEVIAPQGPGHGPELVSRLGQLNLVNRPMTAAEGEWAYLRRNVDAQGLGKNAAVKSALADADGLEDAVEHVLFAERADQAIGVSEPDLHRFAKQIRLDAEAKALPDKVRLLREGVAKATGHANGEALAASAGYDPTPRRSAGWFSWGRFDVAANPAAVRAAFGSNGLTHQVHNIEDLPEMMRTGVLASTNRRAVMGIAPGKGTSEPSDKKTGGANSVFMRVNPAPTGSWPTLFWKDPTTVLSRADWYAYTGDHFGSLNAASGHSVSGKTTDPKVVAGFCAGSNEVMVRHGVDLLGAEAPSLIRCANKAQRTQVMKILGDKGITHLGGKPIDQVVKA